MIGSYSPLPVPVGAVDVRTGDERTLTGEILDNPSQELVWVGRSKREASGQIEIERLQAVIRNIVSAFPSGPPTPHITE